jgi:hypothetical protein
MDTTGSKTSGKHPLRFSFEESCKKTKVIENMKKVKANIDPVEVKDWYVANFRGFENSLNGSREIPFHEIRKSALSKFSELGFPGRRDEEWKYTNISPILRHKFQMTDRPAAQRKRFKNSATRGKQKMSWYL